MNCLVCGRVIYMTVQKGTGFCSQHCEKFSSGELSKERYEELRLNPRSATQNK